MGVNTTSGARLYIGSTAIPNNIEDLTDTQALADFQEDSYVEVGEIENLGEVGDEATDVTFASLKDSRTRHFKGTRDAGTMTIVVGDDPTDEGQDALIAAEAQTFDYNFKVVLNDALTLGGSGSEHYFYGKVMSKRHVFNDVNSITRRNFAIGVNSRIVSVDPT